MNTRDLAARLLGEQDRNGQTPAGDEAPRLVTVRLADVLPERLQWLWPGRFPLGKVSLLCGDPELGKSFITIDMAARVSKGTSWPDRRDESNPAGSVVILSAEDDLSDTVRPRLDVAEADVDRIVAVRGVEIPGEVQPAYFNLIRDLAALDAEIEKLSDVRLVIIDPITAYLGKTDSHVNAEVRAALAPLADLASRRRLAVVAVTHLSKTVGPRAIYRAIGSIAFIAAARACWMVVQDADDPTLRFMLRAKGNLAMPAPGLAYRLQSCPDSDHAVVAWEAEPVECTADEALAALTKPSGEQTAAAIEFLRDVLANGELAADEVFKEAEQAGLSKQTVRRAKKLAGAQTRKAGFGRGWVWALPNRVPDEDAQPEDAQPTELSTFEEFGQKLEGAQPATREHLWTPTDGDGLPGETPNRPGDGARWATER